MMCDLHVHTVFSDGKNKPEEIVLEAILRGLGTIGFSDHSYTFFDESYCMMKERIGEYFDTIRSLRDRYGNKIKILAGIEQDYYSNEPTDFCDYVIGSVHYLKLQNDYIEVDWSPQILHSAAERYFGGDLYALAAQYYETVGDLGRKMHPDIIGHFDLISLFNEKEALFSEDDPRYLKPAFAAVDHLIDAGCRVFEINTGAMARGYKKTPYPSKTLRDYIRKKGGRFILSSDSHRKETLCYAFSEYLDETKE